MVGHRGTAVMESWPHIHVWWIKIGRDTKGGIPWESDPSPWPDCTAQSSSPRKINPHNSGCKNQWGLGQWKKLLDFQETLLKEPTWT